MNWSQIGSKMKTRKSEDSSKLKTHCNLIISQNIDKYILNVYTEISCQAVLLFQAPSCVCEANSKVMLKHVLICIKIPQPRDKKKDFPWFCCFFWIDNVLIKSLQYFLFYSNTKKTLKPCFCCCCFMLNLIVYLLHTYGQMDNTQSFSCKLLKLR